MEQLDYLRRLSSQTATYFDVCRDTLTRKDLLLMRRMTVVYLICVVVYLVAVCLPQGNPWQTRGVIIFLWIHIALTAVAWSSLAQSFLGFRITVRLFGYEILAAAIWLGIFVFPYYPAVLFPLVLVLMTQIYTLPPNQTLLTLVSSSAIFLLLSALYKPTDILWVDVITTVTALGISLIACFSQLRYKLESFAMQQDLENLCAVDGMTGVLNKNTFEYRIGEFLRTQGAPTPLALAFIDIDHFKDINDRFGHKRGDEVLLTFSKLLKSLFSMENCRMGRFGGDEFVIFLRDAGSIEQVRDRFQLLLDEMEQVSRADLPISCSIGVTYVEQQANPSYTQMLLAADQALYAAKQSGRAQLCLTKLSESAPQDARVSENVPQDGTAVPPCGIEAL